VRWTGPNKKSAGKQFREKKKFPAVSSGYIAIECQLGCQNGEGVICEFKISDLRYSHTGFLQPLLAHTHLFCPTRPGTSNQGLCFSTRKQAYSKAVYDNQGTRLESSCHFGPTSVSSTWIHASTSILLCVGCKCEDSCESAKGRTGQ